MKNLIKITFALVSIGVLFSCLENSNRNLEPNIELRIFEYNPQERGKFIEICIDKELDRFDYYHYEVEFQTKSNQNIKGSGLLHPKMGSNSQKCFKQNVFLYSTRHNNIFQIIENHLNKGNIAKCGVTIFTSKNKEKVYSQKTFFEL